MTLRKTVALTLLLAGASVTARAATKPAECPSGCLLDFVNRYLDAMITHDASTLPLAPGLKATQNGKAFQPEDGLWKTAQAVLYRETIADPTTGQAVFFGVVAETEGQALFVLRLAVARGKIAEIETLVARKGAHRLFNPEGLRTVKSVWNTPVPTEERLPRARLIEIANSYFEGIEKHTGESIPFHPDCNRTENGVQTTNNDSDDFLRPGCSAGIKQFGYIQKVRGRRYPLVDEARGLVFAIVQFDVPGQAAPAPATADLGAVLATTPRTLLLYELFKIETGRIREILAFMANAPLGASSGWPR
jgi:hypothetical protein